MKKRYDFNHKPLWDQQNEWHTLEDAAVGALIWMPIAFVAAISALAYICAVFS